MRTVAVTVRPLPQSLSTAKFSATPSVTVGVGVGVGVSVGVSDGVGVGEDVTVAVGVGVELAVGVGVDDAPPIVVWVTAPKSVPSREPRLAMPVSSSVKNLARSGALEMSRRDPVFNPPLVNAAENAAALSAGAT